MNVFQCVECGKHLKHGYICVCGSYKAKPIAKGGKREGAGRPPTDTPARHIVKARLTDEQYAHWLEIGASRWIKRMLDESRKPRVNTNSQA